MLQIFVTHNIRIRGASTPLRAAITKALTLDNPVYAERKLKRRPTWGVDKKIQLYVMERGDLVAPRGFLKELEDILKAQGITPSKAIVKRLTEGQPVDFGPWNPDFKLMEDQIPAVEAATKENGVLVAPAGSGKTVMGMAYILNKGVPTLWLTHTQDLLYQAKEEAEKMLLGVGRVGVLGDGKKDYGDGKLIVATVQTLQLNPHLIEGLKPIIGTVVVDEAHHFPAPAFIDVAGLFPAANMLGVTATPERKDLLEVYMYKGIGPKVYEITRDGLYESGRLVKPEIKFIYTDFDYEQASDRRSNDSVDAGGDDMDYVALTNALIHDEKRAKLVAEKIVEAAYGNYQIVITESVRYCYILRDLVEKFARARWGIAPRIAVVHGPIQRYKWVRNPGEAEVLESRAKDGVQEYKIENYTEEEFKAWQLPKAKRKEIIEAGKAKQIDILFATQLAREGLNMPHLTIGHMAMPKRGDAAGSKNGASVEQEIGRIMRPDRSNPDKKAVWYDYVDYGVGVYKSQYQSRRSVYKRLGLSLPKKPRTEKEDIIDFLGSKHIFDLPL